MKKDIVIQLYSYYHQLFDVAAIQSSPPKRTSAKRTLLPVGMFQTRLKGTFLLVIIIIHCDKHWNS